MIITQLVNPLKACGETITEQYFIMRILGSLAPRFNNVVGAIEESKDLARMSKEELQSSLEAHEQRIEERNSAKAKAEITLQTRFNEKDKKSKGKLPIKSKGNFLNLGGRESQSSKNSICQKGESRYNKDDGQEENVMENVRGAVHYNEKLYLDPLCSKHMKGRKYWFVKINRTMKNKVKFTDEWMRSGYKNFMENRALCVMDVNEVLILKAFMAGNRNFKVELKVIEHRCLSTTDSREKWIWHYRLWHLNFRVINVTER
ncbi:uncharacterized protein LOC131623737 [Vicia villosa]|uniref:uncharacterized protein LOC131623737 n=1 Tax=Vicia villosa TaxID=3911 RepID=UPI00273C0C7B|nr:uncharacterized protein LOC131623737 [Vicia villosa]